MKTFDEILKGGSFILVERREVVLCARCDGTGSYTEQVCTDYHRDEYDTLRYKCKVCKGDGRMVKTVRKIEARINEESDIQSYVDFVGDPYSYNSNYVRLMVDNRDRSLEHKYPDLEKMSYNNYDTLLEKYKLLELMKKEDKTW